MSRVAWSTTAADDVEGVVGVLLCRENPDASRIKPSRGDGGIDVLVPSQEDPRAIEVYQVKSFTGRLTPQRKSQAESSLRRVRTFCHSRGLRITAWYLTVPMNWTNEVRDWFLKATAGEDFPCHWRGEEFLDGLAAKYPDVIDYYLHHGRERLVEATAQLSQALRLAQRMARRPMGPEEPDNEPPALQPREALEGLTAVYEVLNRDDPHYRYDFSVSGERPAVDHDEHLLVAVVQEGSDETHWATVKIFAYFKEAVIERPVPGSLSIDPRGSEELTRDIQLFADFGRPFHAPPGTVTSEVDLPGGLGGRLEGGAAAIGPAVAQQHEDLGASGGAVEGRQLRMAVLDTAGEVIAEPLMIMQPRTMGARGVREAGEEQHGAVGVEIRADLTEKRIALELQGRPLAGRRPELLLEGLRFRAEFREPHSFRLRPAFGPGGAPPVPIPGRTAPSGDSILELADALALIQGFTSTQVYIPQAPSDSQWDSVLQAARLLRGEVIHTTWTHLQVHLHPGLEITPEERFAVRAFLPLTVDLPDHQIELGLRQIDLPIARVDPESREEHDDHHDVRMTPAGSDVALHRYCPDLPADDEQ